jgi:hypothetical protein
VHLAVACPEEEGLRGSGAGGRVGEADHHAKGRRVSPPWPALAAFFCARRVEAHPTARLQAHGDLERRRRASCEAGRGVRVGSRGAHVYDAVDEVLEPVAGEPGEHVAVQRQRRRGGLLRTLLDLQITSYSFTGCC